MLIIINEDYRIQHSKVQSTTQTRRFTEKGDEVWENTAYDAKLMTALKRAFEISLAEHHKVKLKNIEKVVTESLQEFIDQIEVYLED